MCRRKLPVFTINIFQEKAAKRGLRKLISYYSFVFRLPSVHLLYYKVLYSRWQKYFKGKSYRKVISLADYFGDPIKFFPNGVADTSLFKSFDNH